MNYSSVPLLVYESSKALAVKLLAPLLARSCMLTLCILAIDSHADPVAVDDERSMISNSSITINLLANDFSDTGNAISVQAVGNPANGTVALNQDGSVLYTPNTDFVGIDTFTYTLLEANEIDILDAGLVTVTVSESRLPVIFESGNARGFAEAFARACNNIRALPIDGLGAVRRTMLDRCDAIDALSIADEGLTRLAINQLAPEETLSFLRTTMDSSRTQTSGINQRIQAVRTGDNSLTFNGSKLMPSGSTGNVGGSAGDDDSNRSPLGFFVTLQYEDNERDKTEFENGYDSGVTSLTLGTDYRIKSNYLIGAAIGLNQSDLDFNDNNGELESELTNLFVYNSFNFKYASIDAQLGYGAINFSSTRHIGFNECAIITCEISANAFSKTKGTQLQGSINIQAESHRDALSIYPFLRIDYVESEIDAFGEQGAGGFSMLIDKQKSNQITASTGVQISYAVRQSWGVMVPTATFSIYNDVDSDRDLAIGRFSFDTDPNNTFALESDGVDTNYYQFGVGGSALFTHGVSAYIQYQQLISYEYLASWQIQAGFKYEF